LKKNEKKAANYLRDRETRLSQKKLLSEYGRDIGELPPVKNSLRKAKAIKSFKYFCEEYLEKVFYNPWSSDHLKAIKKIQKAVVRGELFALAMPRGQGKTALCHAALIWAALTGLHEYIFAIGATKEKAKQIIENLKTELSTNELLLEDFPEVIYPITKLENQARRCEGQLYQGKQTHIVWQADKIVFPLIPGSKSSCCCIETAGITGNIRGPLFKRPDGRMVRPSLVLPDDPQTDASAKSPDQCRKRLGLVNGAILGMAGPDKKIAGLMPLTVIEQDDMADQVLNTKKHPEWQGERCKLVYKFPSNLKMWDKYREILNDSFRQGLGKELATEFYKKNRQEMDRGSKVAWEHRFVEDEISAIQYAMNLKFRDEAVFFAEYQNEPMNENESDPEKLTPDDIMLRLNGLKRGIVPHGTITTVSFFDPGADKIHYTVMTFKEGFTGAVIDYGIHPKGLKSLRDGGLSIEAGIKKGLEFLDQTVVRKDYYGEQGDTYRIELCLIDEGYMPEAVQDFCRGKSAIYMPSIGLGIGPDQVPIPERKKKVGETLGWNWMRRKIPGLWRILFDASRWKTFGHRRFLIAKGETSSITLWGEVSSFHFEWAVQVASSERKQPKQGRSGRTVDMWYHNPNVPNHFFDNLTGCLVAASVVGIKAINQNVKVKKKRKKVNWAQKQREARERYDRGN